MQASKKQSKVHLVVILGLLSAIGPFSIDMYLPAFPDIAKGLHSSIGQVTLSLSSFFIGISVGQLLYGPLLDKYGRKKPLYFGLLVYLLASAGCAWAYSTDALIKLRFLQALGGCVGMVASRAMVRDLFDVKENAKIFSLLMLVVAVSPIIAPTLGGYVTAAWGWRFVFVVLITVVGLILLAVYFFLEESKEPNRKLSLHPQHIVKEFTTVFKHPQFYTYAFTGAIAASGMYAYIGGSPYVFMDIFKVSERQYGWIFALIAMGLIGASQLNSVLLKNYRSEEIIKVALTCQSLTGIILFTCSLFGVLELFSTIFLIFIFLCCQGFIFPNSSALSLAPFSQNAGTASALMGAIQMGIGAFSSALVSLFHNHTALPMTGVMMFCAMTSFTVFTVGKKIIVRQASIVEVEEQSAEMISTS
jgi:MFS transporter, DHA1 family, multidrug resistance protein